MPDLHHPACVCIDCSKLRLADPKMLARIARNEMPACFTPTRESFVAMAQIALERMEKPN